MDNRLVLDYLRTHCVADTAKRFKMPVSTLYSMAHKHGVTPPPNRRGRQAELGTSRFKVLRDLLNGAAVNDTANKYNVSRQTISQVKKEAKMAGFVFPADRRKDENVSIGR